MMINQIPVAKWPESLNEKYAMIRSSPSDISAASGIYFEPSYDSLDEFQGAILELDAQQVGLLYYENSPVRGTIIVLASTSSAEDKEKALRAVISTMQISESELFWRSGRNEQDQ